MLPDGQFTRFLPIAKVDDEQRMVWGYASTQALDLDDEIVKLSAIKEALPDYMQWANIREMHTSSAVGTARHAETDDVGLWLGAHIVDDSAWRKVKERVYKGFSIGGKVEKKVGKCIEALKLIEISIVDRPANPECRISIIKAEKPGEVPLPVSEDGAEILSTKKMGEVVSKAIAAMPPAVFTAEEVGFFGRMLAKMSKRDPMAGPTPGIEPFSPATSPYFRHEYPPSENQIVAPAGHHPRAPIEGETNTRAKPEDTPGGRHTDPVPLRADTPVSLIDDWEVPEIDVKPVTTPDKLSAAIAQLDAVFGLEKSSDAPYGDVHYADPGYQSDGKKRYPVDTPEHIRAAWSYIHQGKNHSGYTPEQVSHIESAIVAAWKNKIDPSGPPSAGKTAGAESMTDAAVEKRTSGKMLAAKAAHHVQMAAQCHKAAMSCVRSLAEMHKAAATGKAAGGGMDHTAAMDLCTKIGGHMAAMADHHDMADVYASKAAGLVSGEDAALGWADQQTHSVEHPQGIQPPADGPTPGKAAFTQEQVDALLKIEREKAELQARAVAAEAKLEVFSKTPAGPLRGRTFDIGKSVAAMAGVTEKSDNTSLLLDGVPELIGDGSPENRQAASARAIGNMIKNGAVFGRSLLDPNFRGKAAG